MEKREGHAQLGQRGRLDLRSSTDLFGTICSNILVEVCLEMKVPKGYMKDGVCSEKKILYREILPINKF